MTKRKWLLAFYALILCVSISFAWILDPNKNASDSFFLQYGDGANQSLVVSPKDLEMIIYTQKDGQWKTVGSSKDVDINANRFTVDPKSVIPHAAIPFRIRLKNKSDSTIRLRLMMTGIVCDSTLVADDLVYVSAMGGANYAKYDVTSPTSVYFPINDGEVVEVNENKNLTTYDIVLYDEIEVPATSGNNYVELDGYFYFDKRMTVVCQNKTFYVSSFRAVQK